MARTQSCPMQKQDQVVCRTHGYIVAMQMDDGTPEKQKSALMTLARISLNTHSGCKARAATL
eukprot:scaffold401201_cov23-Prasinocladus_malaysianus.AAC.1